MPAQTGTQDEQANPIQADSGFDWAEFNKRKKAETAEWIQTSPFERLASMREVAGVLLRLMYKFLYLGGKTFEKKQRLLVAAKKPRTYNILEAWRGADLQTALGSMIRLLWSNPKAILPHRVSYRLRALRFRMISCAACALHTLLRVRRKQCPYRIFKILDGDFADLLTVPPCMRDPLADMILETYDSKQNYVVEFGSCG